MKEALDNTLVIVIIILTLSSSIAALENEDIKDGDSTIYHFHVGECKDCEEAGRLIEEPEEKYPLESIRFKIDHNTTNRELYRTSIENLQCVHSEKSYPALSIGEKNLPCKDSNRKY